MSSQRGTGQNLERIVRPPTDTYQVLHVDDEPGITKLAATILQREQQQFEVITETSAQDGLDHVNSGDLDGIISDYDMPGMNGLEFLEEVRTKNPDLPFILFTGKGSEEIASEAISAGVTDYLQKGAGTERYALLAHRLTNAIDRYRAKQQMVRGFNAMETVREGIALLDEDGHFLYVNNAYAEIVGYDRETLLDKHWELLYPEEAVESVYTEILPAVPQQGRWTGQTTYVRQDGNRIQIDHALSYTEDGTLVCLIKEVQNKQG